MNKRRRPYSVNGAVLIMVLTVMFVLIFLLAGAVAVVYTSNNRVMMQYEESQAYYTARSVLDVYREMILKDDDTSKVTGATYYELKKTDVGGSITYSTDNYTDVAPGRALELDLYRVPVSVVTDRTDDNYNNYYLSDNVKKFGVAYDVAADTEDFRTHRNLTAVDFSGSGIPANYMNQYCIEDANFLSTGHTMNASKFEKGVSDTLVYYVNHNGTKSQFDQYQQKPTGSNQSPNKLIDPGSTVKLTVQVLERIYDMSDDPAYTTFGERFANGNRKDDNFIIKVTSEVMYDGEKITTSEIMVSNPIIRKATPASALTTFSGIDSSTSGFSVGGGMSSLEASPNAISLNANSVSGAIFTEGDVDFHTAGTTTLDDGACWTIKGNLIGTNQQVVNPKGDNSFIYVGGTVVENPNKMTFGSTTHKVAFMAGRIDSSANGLCVNGTTYCGLLDDRNGADASCKNEFNGKLYVHDVIVRPNCNNVSKYDATTNTLTLESQGFGSSDIYISGHIILPGMGDGVTTGTTEIEELRSALGLNLNDLILDVDSININSTSASVTKISSTPVNVNYNDPSIYSNTLTSDHKKEVRMADGTTYQLETAQSIYGAEKNPYYEDTAFIDASTDAAHAGDLVDYTNKDSGMITAQKMAKTYTGTESCKLSTGTTIGANSTIGVGKYILNTGDCGNLTVNTGSDPVIIQFKEGGGSFSGNINVTGSGECVFLVPEDGSEYCFGTSGGGLTVMYDSTWNDDDKGVKNGKVYSGDANGTPSPKINMYVGGSSKIKVVEGGSNKSKMTAYIYAPQAEFSVDTNVHGFDNLEYYVGGESLGTAKYWLVGNCVCKKYTNSNCGIVFLSGDQSGGSNPGKRLYDWSAMYYSRD